MILSYISLHKLDIEVYVVTPDKLMITAYNTRLRYLIRVQVEEATCFSAVKYVMQMSLRVIVLN